MEIKYIILRSGDFQTCFKMLRGIGCIIESHNQHFGIASSSIFLADASSNSAEKRRNSKQYLDTVQHAIKKKPFEFIPYRELC